MTVKKYFRCSCKEELLTYTTDKCICQTVEAPEACPFDRTVLLFVVKTDMPCTTLPFYIKAAVKIKYFPSQ